MRIATRCLTLSAALVGALARVVHAQDDAGPSEAIRLNQLGFLPLAPKSAVVVTDTASTFTVERVLGGGVVLRGKLTAPRSWPFSGETVRRAELSALTRPGTYVLVVPGVGRSFPFEIETRGIHEV